MKTRLPAAWPLAQRSEKRMNGMFGYPRCWKRKNGIVKSPDPSARSMHGALEWSAPALDGAIWFAGEAQDLQEMLGNLLDNAGYTTGWRLNCNSKASNCRLACAVEPPSDTHACLIASAAPADKANQRAEGMASGMTSRKPRPRR